MVITDCRSGCRIPRAVERVAVAAGPASRLASLGCARFACQLRSIPAAAKLSGSAGNRLLCGGSSLCFISVSVRPLSLHRGGRRQDAIVCSFRVVSVTVSVSDIAINDPSRSSIPPWRTVTRCTGGARRQREGGKRHLIRRQGTNSWSRRPTTRRRRDAPE